MPKLPRVQRIVLPILRAAPALSGAKIGSWEEDVDFRHLPMINVRRIGGVRNSEQPTMLGSQIVEMAVFTNVDQPTTEDLYEDALDVLYEAVRSQQQTPSGYLHSIKETMGNTEFGSPFQGTWRSQGLIKLGVRPPKNTSN